MSAKKARFAPARTARPAVFLAAVVLVFAIAPSASGAPAAPPFTSISAGAAHTCVLTSAGAVKCWGSNRYGQLGNGVSRPCNAYGGCSKRYSRIPVDVVGLEGRVKAIAAGGGHTCALTSSGGVKCWGYNASGQLGNGQKPCRELSTCTKNASSTPVDVVGLTSGVSAIAAGEFHTCAVTNSGGVKCWGSNTELELGTTGPNRSTPVDVDGLTSGASAIAAGAHISCAVTSGAVAKCWGAGYRGSPVAVAGLASRVTAITIGGTSLGGNGSTSFHACALTSGGGAKCWGDNVSGELGNGSRITTGDYAAADVVGLTSGVTKITAGEDYTCAIAGSGAAKCWGENQFGQLGNGSTADSSIPVDVGGLTSGVVAISAGVSHTCVLTSGGGVKCWPETVGGPPVDVRFPSTPAAKPPTTSPGSAARPQGSYRLRWPSSPGRTVTYDLRFKSPHLRAMSLHVYGHAVPRGFGFDFIVACEHRGPAILNWDWAQRDGTVHITVKMTTGTCDLGGPTVAGKYAEVTVRRSSGSSSTSRPITLSAGRWTGSVKQSNIGSRFGLTLTLPPTPRSMPGRVEIPAAGCVGTVRYLRTDVGGRLVFAITWRRGRCSNGTMWVHVLGRDSLSYRWEDGRGAFSVATLRRTGTSAAGGSASFTAELRTLVDRIESVLAQSAAGRRELGTALANGFNCSISPRAAAQRIASVVDNRRSILGQLAGLRSPDRQTREALGLLRSALQHSITADIHYRDGFSSIAGGRCPIPPNADFTLARRSDVLASAAKQRFVALFNELARRVDRRTWSASEI